MLINKQTQNVLHIEAKNIENNILSNIQFNNIFVGPKWLGIHF